MAQKRLNTKWTRGVPEDSKENLEKLIRNSKIVLSRLQEIILEDLREELKITEADYDTPSWGFKQAHLNGKQQYARQMLSLLDFLNKERT